MKKIAKKVLYGFAGIFLCRLLRLFYHPSEKHAGKLKFKGDFKLSTPEGRTFRLYNNAFVFETHLFWLGLERYSWERQTRKIWNHLCPQVSTILDIGANSGVYSVLAKVYNPNATVIAFEPQPNIFHALKMNNTVNGFDMRTENLALSNVSGKLPFYNYGPDTFTDVNTTAGSLNKSWREDRQSSISVDVTTLQQYCEQKELSSVDLIKMDVETLEFEVLEGYGSLLFQHRPMIILEVQSSEIGERIENLFVQQNYRFYNIDEESGLNELAHLGRQEENHNYLICPAESQQMLE